MVAAGVDALVAGDAARRLEALHQAQLLQHLEGAVDAGPADADLAPAQLLLQLQRGHRAAVTGERFDDGGAGAAAAVAGLPQARQRVLGPGVVDGGAHQPIVASAGKLSSRLRSVRSRAAGSDSR
jgi:hypothetical protein